MKLYFVKSAGADNYIMAETSEGLLASNCASDGVFAGIDLNKSYDDAGEHIDGEAIARKIAEAIGGDLDESDLAWMGEPILATMSEWEASQESLERWQRDEAFLIDEF